MSPNLKMDHLKKKNEGAKEDLKTPFNEICFTSKNKTGAATGVIQYNDAPQT
jgi:hypothetical protein